jgi:GNAT superfamily N-acetyltransferase
MDDVDHSLCVARPTFYGRLTVARGTRADWPRFAPWHYRGHTIGLTRACWTLLDDEEPVGICILSPAALGNAVRNRIFGRTVWKGADVNRLFCNVSRFVLDPRYRGCGIAADFLREAVERAPTRYVEMVTSMGEVSQFWRRGGFRDFGPTAPPQTVEGRGVVYQHDAKRPGIASERARAQSRAAQMHYYLCDREKALAPY